MCPQQMCMKTNPILTQNQFTHYRASILTFYLTRIAVMHQHMHASHCSTLALHTGSLAADYMVVLMMRSVHACATLLHSSPAQREHLAMGTVHACVTLLRSNPIRGHTSMLMQTACFAQTALATCRLTKRCPKDKFGVSRH